MIRTLHVVGTRIGGGAENFLVRLATALESRGHPTHVVTRPGSPVVEDVAGRVPCTTVGMRSGADFLSARKIRKVARSHGAEVVQSYMGRATRLTRMGRRGPVHVGRLGNYYRLRAYKHCDAWIGNTLGICRHLVAGGFPKERIFHIYNFVDVPTPTSAQVLQGLRYELDLPADALVLVSPGRFVPVKGFDVLLRAFARIPATVAERPVHLVLVGDGPSSRDLERLSERLDVQDRVRWTGWVASAGPYYDMADLVVFPPRREEPFGNVVLEAWSHGAPLVTTRFRGAEEFVRPERDARVVPCEDPPTLAAAVEDLLKDDNARRTLGQGGLTRARSDFSEEHIVSQYLDLYGRLIRQGPRRR
ncbi:MAG: glycosyltransferase [Gemmatimonadales bacterium]|nr:MAG: glycosyltransferase [Gemmatimonadales bacterium]